MVENDASVVVVEGLNALGDMFIRHNALSMMKDLNNTRHLIQTIEQGFQLIAQLIENRVSKMIHIGKTTIVFCYFRFLVFV